MALRPIDVSITVQRTPEMRAQTEGLRPEIAQTQFADKLNKDIAQQERQVNQPQKTEDAKVQPDGKGNAGYAGKQKKRGKNAQPTDKNKQTGQSGSMLDILV
ncbi:MAG: hypothetical protein FWE82_02305 [Defluviitaleaceae bacterium]|nr:hypothetical protein [Defluviitaleaceae bacterium]